MDKQTADKILEDIKKGYNDIAESFSNSREKLYWDELKRFVDYAREGEYVLDVGCGNGRTYELFKEKKVRYAGLDVSEALINKARERLKGEPAEFMTGSVLDMPVADGTFDVAVAVAVLHHIPSEAYRLRAMAELARSVKPGGYVLMTTWNLWQPRYWKMVFHQKFGHGNDWDFGDFKITWKKPFFPRYYHAFRMKELRRLCEAAELQVVEQYYVKKGEMTNWLRGENLVTIARKNPLEQHPHPDTKNPSSM